MAAIRMMKRVGKKATKFQFTATYQSIVLECQNSTWVPHSIAIAWSRRGRRFITTVRSWEPSPDNKLRAVLVWPEEETMETVITLYKGPKDKNYETKEWEFAVLDIDEAGKRKVLATHSVNMVRYASSLPIEHELHLMMKPVSRKIKKAILEVSLCSVFLKEGKATDDDMISLASNLSVSNLSTIGFLEDDDEGPVRDEDRPASPVDPSSVISIDALLSWAQEITQGYHGVSIANMTTSWRNGLAFLAIIHYYKPQLFDYDQLLPNSIKENNKLAFELARSLGISCPLTVNMMLTNNTPDKLAVTSFVYQMYSYFTKATPSAIAKDSFDIGVIQQLIPTSPVSLTGTPNHKKHDMYSRHSKSSLNEGTEVKVGEEAIVNAVSIAEKVELKPTDNMQPQSMPVEDNSNGGTVPTSSLLGSTYSSHLKPNVLADTSLQESSDCKMHPKSSTPSKPSTDPSLLEAACSFVVQSKSNTSSSSLFDGSTTPSTSFAIECGNSQMSSDLSASSLMEDAASSALPTGVNAPGISIAKAGAPGDLPAGSSIETKSVVPPTDDEAKRLLRKKEVQKLLKQVRNRDGLFNTSKSSCDSDPFENQYTKAARDLIAATFDSSAETVIGNEARESDKRTKARSEPPANIENQSSLLNTNATLDQHSPTVVSIQLSSTCSETATARDMNSEDFVSPLHRSPELLGTSTAADNDDNAPCVYNTESRSLPEMQPIPTGPSKSLERLIKEAERLEAERKEAERLEAERKEAERLEAVRKEAERLEAERKEAEQFEALRKEACVDGNNGASAEDWNQHTEALLQDVLLSQSDYVKGELTKLKKKLLELESRATSIEVDIRDAMSQGDKRREELLMQEWFGILNRKNKLIKQQINLNILDKEEDLDRRQFFLRKELRSLGDLQDKTPEQKTREAQLLQQLVDLVDELDRLERKKMATQGRGPDDAEPVVPQTSDSHPKPATKECILS